MSSAKESILKVKSVLEDLKILFIKKIWVIIICAVLGGALGFYLASRSEKVYNAKLTFMMEGGNKGGMASAYAGLAKQFGVMGGGGEALSGDKIVELVKTKKIVFGGLMMDAVVDGKKDLLVNHFLQKIVYKDTDRKCPVVFSKTEPMTYKHDSILDIVYSYIMLNEFSSILSKKDGIMTLKFSSTNEDIAVAFLNNTISFLTSFFTKKTVEKEQRAVDLMSNKVDSLLSELQSTEQQLASTKDHNNNIQMAQGMLGELRLTRKAKILNMLYAEGVKNLEIARFALLEKEVVIQKIDEPRRPLPFIKKGKVRTAVTFAMIGAILAMALVYIRKQYNTIINA
ncbi:MAG: hypothetical protein ACKOXB_06035 [Flavobacteriales bacterium]